MDQEGHTAADLMETENHIEISLHSELGLHALAGNLMGINQHMAQASRTEKENLMVIGQVDQATLEAQQVDQVLRLEDQDQTGRIEI